jgi:hypothetical protein
MADISELSNAAAKEKPALFSEPDKTSDIVFIVEDKKIHFTKAFLAVSSEVFDRMFNGDFAEKTAQEIDLPGKKHWEVVEFFKQFHPVHAGLALITGRIKKKYSNIFSVR